MIKELYIYIYIYNIYLVPNNLISLRILFASIRSAKALGIFLMATLVLVSLSWAEMTIPYAPCPITLINSYLFVTTNVLPK